MGVEEGESESNLKYAMVVIQTQPATCDLKKDENGAITIQIAKEVHNIPERYSLRRVRAWEYWDCPAPAAVIGGSGCLVR
jgi:hypothetical protein